jgi:hypothetical protein
MVGPVARPFADAGPLEVRIEAVGQRFPIVVRDRRIKVMLEMVEMIEGDNTRDGSAKKPRAR